MDSSSACQPDLHGGRVGRWAGSTGGPGSLGLPRLSHLRRRDLTTISRLLRQPRPAGAVHAVRHREIRPAHPEAVREWALQHEIACHTMNHPQMSDLKFEQQLAEIRDCASLLERLTGTRICIGFLLPRI